MSTVGTTTMYSKSKAAQYTYLAGKSVVAYRVAPPDAKVIEEYFDGSKMSHKMTMLPNYHYVTRFRTKQGIAFGK